MSVKPFFVDALSSALDLGLATPDDVLKHVTPDLLAHHLPRPLWARLLTACIGASRVDATIVVETIGVSNLCEHIPPAAIWACIADIGARALGGEVSARPATATAPAIVSRPAAVAPNKPLSISGPPAPEPAKPAPPAPPPVQGPSIPAPAMVDADAEETSMPSRPRTNTGGRFRQTSTNIGRLAQSNQQQRRPQAAAPTPPAPLTLDPATDRPRPVPTARRGETEVEVEIETELESTGGDWRSALAVEDEQLVDWSASEETLTSAGDDPAFRNKR